MATALDSPTIDPIAVPPRLLRIPDAAHYLSCTYGFVEAMIREKSVPSVILGKRRLIDIRDLDAYVERVKNEQCGGVIVRHEKQRAA